MNNKIILESLSMDLLRVAKGLYRGSDRMAERFLEEALLRKDEVEQNELKPYFKKVLIAIFSLLAIISATTTAIVVATPSIRYIFVVLPLVLMGFSLFFAGLNRNSK